MAESSLTPIDIITKGEWQHAFFTTYALSLSFFESQLLKEGLYRRGCRDIHILTDVKGYQMSLSERQSARVGNEYRLSPVRIQNGIFHPKTVYLAGKEDDLLLVGSGNLTFGGYGRNIECLEAFRKSEQPGIFAQYAEFLNVLEARSSLWLPSALGLETTISHIRSNLSEGIATFPQAPQLLHSTNTPVGEQVVSAIDDMAPVSELRVLSPFFEQNARGILEFATRLNAPRVTVGLIPEHERQTSFNFEGNYGNIQIEAALARCDKPRNLHAKWFELCLESGERIVLTGSVNATHKSLMSADNIEIGILRQQSSEEASELEWLPTEKPKSYEACEFNAAELEHRLLTVEARLEGDGSLAGEIVGLADGTKNCLMTLSRPDGYSEVFEDVSLSDGQFKHRINDPEAFSLSTGLQLNVQAEGAEGSAWVHVESLLQATRKGFMRPSVIASIFSSEASDDDYIELLHYLRTAGHQHLPAFARPIRKASKRDDRESEEKPDELLRPDAFSTYAAVSTDIEQVDQASKARTDALHELIFRIRQHLNQPATDSKGASIRSEIESEDGESEQQDDSREEISKKAIEADNAIADFESHMQELLRDQKTSQGKAAVGCLWIEGAFFLFSRRSDGPGEKAELFAKTWLSYLLPCFEGNATEALKNNVFDLVAVLAALDLERPSGPRNLARLHEKLNRFLGKEVSIDDFEAYDSFSKDSGNNQYAILLHEESVDYLKRAVSALLETKTIEQQLEMVRRSYMKPLPSGLTMSSGPKSALRSFKEQIDLSCDPPVVRKDPSRNSCPHCHMRLSDSTLATLRRDWFVECSATNGHFIIW